MFPRDSLRRDLQQSAGTNRQGCHARAARSVAAAAHATRRRNGGPSFRHAPARRSHGPAGGRSRRAAPPRCGLAAPLCSAKASSPSVGVEQGLPRARRRRARRLANRWTAPPDARAGRPGETAPQRRLEAAAPRLATPHRPTGRAAARRRAGPVQHRRHRADGRVDPRRAPLPLREQHTADAPKVGKTSKGTERYLEWSEHDHTPTGSRPRAMTA